VQGSSSALTFFEECRPHVFVNEASNKGGGLARKREEAKVAAALIEQELGICVRRNESMNNLVNIKSRMLFSNYWYGRSSKQIILEHALFWAGVLATVITPQLFWSFSEGMVGLVTFAIAAVAGTGIGLVRYYRFPFRVNSCVSKAVPRSSETTEKRAA
jgi:hypothetical protein